MEENKKIVYLKEGESLEIRHEGYIEEDVNLSITDAAKKLNMSRKTLYNKIDAELISTVSIGGKQKIKMSEINKYLKQ